MNTRTLLPCLLFCGWMTADLHAQQLAEIAPPTFKAPSPEIVQRVLKELPEADANKDGALSLQEIRTALPQLQMTTWLLEHLSAPAK